MAGAAQQALGQRIRAARHGRLGGMPLEQFGREVAGAIGRPKPFSNVTVSKWEMGRQEPSFGTLFAMARLTALPLEYFAGVGAVQTYSPAEGFRSALVGADDRLRGLAEALQHADARTQRLVLGQAETLVADLRETAAPVSGTGTAEA
jgi:transcriptional regulator with XRE-family HTH domain